MALFLQSNTISGLCPNSITATWSATWYVTRFWAEKSRRPGRRKGIWPLTDLMPTANASGLYNVRFFVNSNRSRQCLVNWFHAVCLVLDCKLSSTTITHERSVDVRWNYLQIRQGHDFQKNLKISFKICLKFILRHRLKICNYYLQIFLNYCTKAIPAKLNIYLRSLS